MSKVSIIVAAYNVEAYIKKCIDSLLSQTLSDIQIIIVDDGSKDSTAKIVQKITDSRLLYVYKQNGGLSSARNYGLQFVDGDYIAFVDGDDWVEPEMYRLMYESAIQNISDVVECAYFKDWKDKQIICNVKWQPNIVQFNPYNVCLKLYKQKLLAESLVQFKTGIWYEDFNFNLKISYYVNKVSFVDVPLYHYIQRDGSIMHTVSKKVLDIFTCCDDIYDFLSQKANYNFDNIKWYFAKELLVASFFRLCKYDAQNNTEYSKQNYIYLKSKFPDWKKSSCLKKRKLINFYLRFCTELSYSIVRFIFYTKYKISLRNGVI